MQLAACDWVLATICKEIVAGCQPLFSYFIHARFDLECFYIPGNAFAPVIMPDFRKKSRLELISLILYLFCKNVESS